MSFTSTDSLTSWCPYPITAKHGKTKIIRKEVNSLTIGKREVIEEGAFWKDTVTNRWGKGLFKEGEISKQYDNLKQVIFIKKCETNDIEIETSVKREDRKRVEIKEPTGECSQRVCQKDGAICQILTVSVRKVSWL